MKIIVLVLAICAALCLAACALDPGVEELFWNAEIHSTRAGQGGGPLGCGDESCATSTSSVSSTSSSSSGAGGDDRWWEEPQAYFPDVCTLHEFAAAPELCADTSNIVVECPSPGDQPTGCVLGGQLDPDHLWHCCPRSVCEPAPTELSHCPAERYSRAFSCGPYFRNVGLPSRCGRFSDTGEGLQQKHIYCCP